MNENDIFTAEQSMTESGEKPIHVASLILGILSIVFAVLVAIVGDVLALAGIALAKKNASTHNVKAGRICSIVGLILAIANHALFVLMNITFVG